MTMLTSGFWNSSQSGFIMPEYGMYILEKCVLLWILPTLTGKVWLDLHRPRKDRLWFKAPNIVLFEQFFAYKFLIQEPQDKSHQYRPKQADLRICSFSK